MELFDWGEWGIAWSFFTTLVSWFILIGGIGFILRGIVCGFNWKRLFE